MQSEWLIQAHPNAKNRVKYVVENSDKNNTPDSRAKTNIRLLLPTGLYVFIVESDEGLPEVVYFIRRATYRIKISIANRPSSIFTVMSLFNTGAGRK